MKDWLRLFGDEVIILCLCFGALLYFTLLALGRWLKQELKIGFAGVFQFFALVASVYLVLWLMHSTVEMDKWPVWLQTASKWLNALLILSGAAIVAQVTSKFFLGQYLWERHNLRVPKLFQDIVVALILLTGLLVAGKVFKPDLDVKVFVGAGGVVVVVLGFALQSLLGDVFAGIALNIERPFRVGDWVQVGGIHGEVMEINWRATRLRTNDNNYLIIPNSSIAKDHIINFYAPDRQHALRITVGVEYDADPATVKKVLAEAARSVDGVNRQRDPTVRITHFGDFAITYEVKYWLDDHAHYQEINDGVRTAIWYALKKAKIKIPCPIREIREEKK